MTEDSPAQRGSPSRDNSSDVGTSAGDGSPARDKGKGVARDEDISEQGGGDDSDGASDAKSRAGADEEDDTNESEEGEHDDSEDDEDEEPKLKYARLTQHLGPVYRNGDATSAFLVAGDKMVRSAPPRLYVEMLTDYLDHWNP